MKRSRSSWVFRFVCRPEKWRLGEEDQTVEHGSRLCAKRCLTLREGELEVCWTGLCGQLQSKLALSLIEKPANVDQGQALRTERDEDEFWASFEAMRDECADLLP
jgi:hypothetical protein